MNKIVFQLAKILFTFFFLSYWVLTLLWNTPTNPVKEKHEELLALTIGRYFPQNWRLFAPNPIKTNDKILLLPFEHKDLNRLIMKSDFNNEKWIDITTPLWKAFQKNRFSSYDRLSRVILGTSRGYLNGPIELVDLQSKKDIEQKNKDVKRAEILKNYRSAFEIVIRRIGSSAIKDFYPFDFNFCCFAVLMQIEEPIQWADRNLNKKRKSKSIFAGYYKIDYSVAKANLYSDQL